LFKYFCEIIISFGKKIQKKIFRRIFKRKIQNSEEIELICAIERQNSTKISNIPNIYNIKFGKNIKSNQQINTKNLYQILQIYPKILQ
jgi:hypothetical protein